MTISAWTNLASGKGEPDWMPLAREFRSCRRAFILHIQSWKEYAPLQALKWKKVKYNSTNKPVDKRGVYAFVLDSSELSSGPFPPLSVVLYIGETGNTGNETLLKRLQNYRNMKAQRDRARVYSMLEQWSEYLEFYYAEVKDGNSTKDCENALLDALLPPVNKKDFSATVRLARDFAFDG